MSRLRSILFLCSILPGLALVAAPGSSETLFMDKVAKNRLAVNNRILAMVNGKPISVLDIMKKMDVVFFQQYPQYIHSVEARHQFYSVSWKRVLQELIDKELITADALDHKVPLSSGDVRQEMEMLFGPNIIGSLDTIGLGYDEAFEMLKGDLLIRRMMYARVNMQAQRIVTPSTVRQAYEEFAKEHIEDPKWTYQIITIRHPNPATAEELAFTAHSLIDCETSLTELQPLLERVCKTEEGKITISDKLVQTDKEISPSNLETLQRLAVNDFSTPQQQTSRDKQKVYRIFYLLDKTEGGSVPFAVAEAQIRGRLMEKAMAEETQKYLQRLRKQYGVAEHLTADDSAEDFQPFALQ